MYDDRDDEDDNLPRLHESERTMAAVEKMRETLNALDGSPMAVSNALVPLEASDVGDVPIDANPRGRALADSDMDCDNGYPEHGGCVVEKDERSGRIIMSDPPNWALAGDTHMSADEGTFIDDITEWA